MELGILTVHGRISTEKRCFEFKKAYLIEGDPRPHYPFNV